MGNLPSPSSPQSSKASFDGDGMPFFTIVVQKLLLAECSCTLASEVCPIGTNHAVSRWLRRVGCCWDSKYYVGGGHPAGEWGKKMVIVIELLAVNIKPKPGTLSVGTRRAMLRAKNFYFNIERFCWGGFIYARN